MGLNWSAGLTALGEGLGDVAAARSKADELEYRNMRDANLRRYQIEDKDRDEAFKLGERAHKDTQRAEEFQRTDEGLGIKPETPRGKSIIEQQEKEREQEQQDELEKIAARQKSESKAKTKSKDEYIAAGMEKVYEKWAGEVIYTGPPEVDEETGQVITRMLPEHLRKQWMERFAKDWDEIQAASGIVPSAPAGTTPAPATDSPFDPATAVATRTINGVEYFKGQDGKWYRK